MYIAISNAWPTSYLAIYFIMQDDYRLLDFPGRIYDEDNSKVVSWSFTDNNNNHSDEHNDDNNAK